MIWKGPSRWPSNLEKKIPTPHLVTSLFDSVARLSVTLAQRPLGREGGCDSVRSSRMVDILPCEPLRAESCRFSIFTLQTNHDAKKKRHAHHVIRFKTETQGRKQRLLEKSYVIKKLMLKLKRTSPTRQAVFYEFRCRNTNVKRYGGSLVVYLNKTKNDLTKKFESRPTTRVIRMMGIPSSHIHVAHTPKSVVCSLV